MQVEPKSIGDLLNLNLAVYSDNFDIELIIPLLRAVLNNEPDEVIWNKVYTAVTESTPPRPASSIQQTPWLRSTSSFANPTEHRKYVDDVLKEELGPMYVWDTWFLRSLLRSSRRSQADNAGHA